MFVVCCLCGIWLLLFIIVNHSTCFYVCCVCLLIITHAYSVLLCGCGVCGCVWVCWCRGVGVWLVCACVCFPYGVWCGLK